MKIAVTGATGFIGRRLVRRLLGAGHSVTAWSRDPERARGTLPVRCQVAAWEPRRVDPDLLDGVDSVVHLAGESVAGGRWTEQRKREIRASRIESTRAIVAAIAGVPTSARPTALVSASAIGYYGDRADELLDERSPPGSGFLADVCRDWEREASAAEDLGVRTAAVRIGVVLGADAGALAKMVPLFRLGLGGRLGGGQQWMSWIHVDDVVGLFARAVEDADVRGPLNGVAPNPVRNRDFTRALARAVGRLALFPVPAAALRVLAGEMSEVLLGSQRVEPSAAKRLGFSFAHPDLEGALADLCADPAHVLEREQLVRRPRDQVFPFFSDVKNLERITPDFLRFRISGMSTPEIGPGTLIDYRLRLHGIPVGWRTRIEEWKPDERFVDVQLRGPYSLWQHTHEFEPVPEGTIVRDRIRYRLPLGALGDLIAGSLVARDVEKIFAHRHARVGDLLETAKPAPR
jgi:uncharacterized protein (TIGR01777 family)